MWRGLGSFHVSVHAGGNSIHADLSGAAKPWLPNLSFVWLHFAIIIIITYDYNF
jgi:hypothetical protein